jgi:hypothetical protein
MGDAKLPRKNGAQARGTRCSARRAFRHRGGNGGPRERRREVEEKRAEDELVAGGPGHARCQQIAVEQLVMTLDGKRPPRIVNQSCHAADILRGPELTICDISAQFLL